MSILAFTPHKTGRKKLAQLLADHLGVKPGEPSKATCYSCHRGALKPLAAPPAGAGGF